MITNSTEPEPQLIDPQAVTQVERMALNEWKKQDKKAKKEICLRISDEYLVYIDQITTTPELWAKLQAIFESKAAVSIVNICREFFQTFAKDGANMEEHIHKLRGLYQQLNARGQLVTDKDLANTLFTSLPEKWSSFITTINTTGMLITLEILIARILDEDRSRRPGTVQQTVLKAQGPGKKSKGGQTGNTKGKCQNCSKKGHYEKECWVKGSGKEGQALAWFKPKNADSAKQPEENEFTFITKMILF